MDPTVDGPARRPQLVSLLRWNEIVVDGKYHLPQQHQLRFPRSSQPKSVIIARVTQMARRAKSQENLAFPQRYGG